MDDLVPGCYNCDRQAMATLPARDDIITTRDWRVTHAFNVTQPGWLVLVPTRHVLSFTDLSERAAEELGLLILRLSKALRTVTGCQKTYMMQFSEAEDFSHLHVHLVPRLPDHPADAIGPHVFTLMTDDEAMWMPESIRDSVALAVRTALD
jgi:diadenosine tetraphosphate (Ap4A) HIT family hydrolase